MHSSLEDIIYLAHKDGKREELLSKVRELRLVHPRIELIKLYEMAYDNVLKK